MPGLSESFLANKSFTLVAAALAFLAAAVLVSVIFRVTFGRRIRLPRNGRARLPRLGTVDAFDLDRQRQLVIIRRDNVEHLLMIGGPNDLVIESQIIRAESRDPRDIREARIRDKELREKEPKDTPPLPAGASRPFPAEAPAPNPPRRKMPFPAAAELEPETGMTAGVRIEEPMPEFASFTVLPTPRPPVFPLPARRFSAPVAPSGSGQGIPNQREPLYGRADPLQRPEPVTGPAKELRRAPVATPFLRPSIYRQGEGTGIGLAPSSAAEMLTGSPNAPSLLPGFEEIPASPEVFAATGTGPETATPIRGRTAPIAASDNVIQDGLTAGAGQAGINALEAEMAKLLGRGPG
jgi:flagellar protein FliO/FliZ